jgi:hypothetical protein
VEEAVRAERVGGREDGFGDEAPELAAVVFFFFLEVEGRRQRSKKHRLRLPLVPVALAIIFSFLPPVLSEMQRRHRARLRSWRRDKKRRRLESSK